jgi:hypothetical protein
MHRDAVKRRRGPAQGPAEKTSVVHYGSSGDSPARHQYARDESQCQAMVTDEEAGTSASFKVKQLRGEG